MAFVPTKPTFGGYSGISNTPAKPTIDLSSIGSMNNRAARNAASSLPGAVAALQTLNGIPGEQSAALGQSIASLAGNPGGSRAEREANKTALELAIGQANTLAKIQEEQKAAEVAERRHQEMLAATRSRNESTMSTAGSNAATAPQPQLATLANTPWGFAQGGKVKACYSKGGKIVGPGTGTSDSIPAKVGNEPLKVSNGEYILPKEVVDVIGVDVLDALVRQLTGKEPGPTMGKDGEMKAETGAYLNSQQRWNQERLLKESNKPEAPIYQMIRSLFDTRSTAEKYNPNNTEYDYNKTASEQGQPAQPAAQAVAQQATQPVAAQTQQVQQPQPSQSAAVAGGQTTAEQQALLAKAAGIDRPINGARAGMVETSPTLRWLERSKGNDANGNPLPEGNAALTSINKGFSPEQGTGVVTVTKTDDKGNKYFSNTALGQANYIDRDTGERTNDYGRTKSYADNHAQFLERVAWQNEKEAERLKNIIADPNASDKLRNASREALAFHTAKMGKEGELGMQAQQMASAAKAAQQKLGIEKLLANEQIRKSQNNEVSIADLARTMDSAAKMAIDLGASPEEQAANRKYVATIQQHILGKLPGGKQQVGEKLPADKKDLVVGKVYSLTAGGLGKWDGQKFNRVNG